MSIQSQSNDQWIHLQTKAFSRWLSYQIQNKADFNIEDYTKNLANGILFLQLAQNLTKNTVLCKLDHNPKNELQPIQKCEKALDMFQKDGINLSEITAKDIYNSNKENILNFIWNLICHYSINQSILDEDLYRDNNQIRISKSNIREKRNESKEMAQKILSWATDKISLYPNIEGFYPYELVLCALLDQYVPEKINYYNLSPNDSKHNFSLAINVMKELGIPVYVYYEEINEYDHQVDEKTLLLQLSSIKYFIYNHQMFNTININSMNEKFISSDYQNVESNNLLLSQPPVVISDSYASSSSMFSYEDSLIYSSSSQQQKESENSKAIENSKLIENSNEINIKHNDQIKEQNEANKMNPEDMVLIRNLSFCNSNSREDSESKVPMSIEDKYLLRDNNPFHQIKLFNIPKKNDGKLPWYVTFAEKCKIKRHHF